MRKVRWSTTRWQLPSRLRSEALRDLLAKGEHKELLGPAFVDGLEKRRDLLDSRHWKLMAIQVPLSALLVFSLLNVDVSISVLGVSLQASKGLREIILVFSATIGLASSLISFQEKFVAEILKAYVARQSRDDVVLKDVLEARYGLGGMPSGVQRYSTDLKVGGAQLTAALVMVIALVLVLCMLVIILLGVHILNIREVYLHPNFSSTGSALTIAFVLLTDALGLGVFFLFMIVQPFQTDEDFRKLIRLRERDEEAYRVVLREIIQEHQSKGFFRRTFGRPKMPRIP